MDSRVLKRKAGRILLYLFLILLAIVYVMPFAQIIGNSLKTYWETQEIPPKLLPKVPQWNNYIDIWSKMDIPLIRWLLNTIFTTSMIVIGIVVSCSFIAYGFARFNGKGKNFWFSAIMCTMFIPIYAKIIPTYVIYGKLGFVDSFLALIVEPFFGSAMYMFLFRQFILTIPRDYDEAALIDGAGYMKIFTKIIVPMLKPAIAAVAILAFVAAWGDYFTPMIFLRTPAKFTISIGLAFINSTVVSGRSNAHWLAAVTVITSIPSLVIFFSAQKYFIGGLTVGAVKG
jgi:multiple sugar transport system permease protein